MKKRIFSVFVILGILFSTTACSASQDAHSSTEGITLTIMGKNSDLKKNYMVRIFEKYEADTGNKLKVMAIEDSDYESTVAQKFAEGDMPDILLHFNNSALNNYDISDYVYYLNSEDWMDGLTEGARAYCQDSDGNMLGLPFWESSISGCYYNKTLLDSFGLRAAATQAEFDALCQALASIGHTPICWPADGCNWMYQFGLDPIFADDPSLLEQLNGGQAAYSDIPAVRDMVEWIANAADDGWFGGAYLDTGWSDMSAALNSGEAAMIFIWDTWFYTDFEEGTYTKEDFALMPIFVGTADSGTYEGGNLNMMMVNKNGSKLESALEFLSFCATEENYNAAFEGVSTVSCFQNQTTNIQSDMVTNAMTSITANQRVSTAEPKIIGYTQEETASAFRELFQGKTDVEGCIERMDGYRSAAMGARE